MEESYDRIDESERAFSPDERLLATYLAERGYNVKALPETGSGRHADALVDGVSTEFKRLAASPTSKTILNRVQQALRGGGQAQHIVLDARGTSLSEQEVERAFRRIAGIPYIRGKLEKLRVIADQFDMSYDFSMLAGHGEPNV
jgi:hypothetical protein